MNKVKRNIAFVLIAHFLFSGIPLHAQTQLKSALGAGLPSVVLQQQNENRGLKERERGSVSGNQNGTMMTQGIEYQIHVLGEVEKPGTYRMGPSVRLAEAIAMAGGISERGTMRRVELRRDNSKNNFIDLDQFLRKGDLNDNPFLQDNDVIFVPMIQQSVRIEGPVKKSGVYELARENNIWDIIQLAGGFTVGASQSSEIVVIRYENEKKRLIKVSNVAEELRRTPILNGDIIVVPHIFTKDKDFDYAFPNLPSDDVFYPSYNDKIYVAGAVLKPGSYDYQGHLTVYDYINLAGADPTTAKVKKTRVMTPGGKEVKKIGKHRLNPGDTIVVPRRQLTGNNALTWYNTFASSLFTFVSLRSLIRDF